MLNWSLPCTKSSEQCWVSQGRHGNRISAYFVHCHRNLLNSEVCHSLWSMRSNSYRNLKMCRNKLTNRISSSLMSRVISFLALPMAISLVASIARYNLRSSSLGCFRGSMYVPRTVIPASEYSQIWANASCNKTQNIWNTCNNLFYHVQLSFKNVFHIQFIRKKKLSKYWQ